MTAAGQCWELPMLGRRTSATGSGLWATPSASDSTRGGTITDSMTGISLVQQMNTPHRWPTPTVCGNHNRLGLSPKSGDGLATAVAKWPTPKARDWKDGRTQGTANRSSPDLGKVVGQSQQAGSLNPTWVEWLMGWPIGHTDLKPLATDKFQQWQQQHGDC